MSAETIAPDPGLLSIPPAIPKSFPSSKRVKFIGSQENPFEFYNLIDYYVSNSRWEGMPLTVLEAMCLKIPCLVSNVVGNNDLIQKDFSGYLFQPDNNESFSRELFKMIDSDNAEFVDNAFREVKEKYNIGLMSKKISKIYSELIS